MTQNERLRALLKEARDWMIDDTCRDCERGGCELRQRIDAALAESPSPDRDEARAEIERLKIALDSIRAARSLLGQLRDHVSDQACEELTCILSDEPLNADGELYLTPSQQAYRRGAEAMREAAMGAAWHSNAMGVHNKIRALPLPEDKP